jgi:hypothetical protein
MSNLKAAPTKATYVAGRRRCLVRRPRSRMFSVHKQLWNATYAALISCGLGTRSGSWVFRRWLGRSLGRNGWLDTCKLLKEVCHQIRSGALSQRRLASFDSINGFPGKLYRWLEKRLSVKGALAFSRLARALPCAPEDVQRKAYSDHLRTLSSRHETEPAMLASLKDFVASRLKGAFRDCTSLSVPTSSAATVTSGRAAGGFNTDLVKEGRAAEQATLSDFMSFLRGVSKDPIETSALARVVERGPKRRLKQNVHLEPNVRESELFLRYATAGLLRNSEGSRVVHNASCIAELGMKARIITVPPAHVFARGDLVRQVLWPAIQARFPECLPYAPHTEDGILARLSGGLGGGQIFLSADLTCATDGFGHDAISAVVDGVVKAGLPGFLASELRVSLGVGREPHLVRYRLSQLTQATREYVEKRYQCIDGFVEVPKTRGSLMGTPCSFSVLSLINAWMSEGLGPRRIICGDDLAALTHADNVPLYASRARGVGSELHQGKSFRSRIGFVFCEAYGLLSTDNRCIGSFRPPSLKEFVRNGNGVMSQHSVDPTSFNRLARVARTIYARQRTMAAKKGRFAELPAFLGGLGHPCKGRLRVPLTCRRRLWELYLCENECHGGAHDPTKYISTLQRSAIPLDRRALRKKIDLGRGWIAKSVVDEPQPGEVFITNRQVATYVAVGANLEYLTAGLLFRRAKAQEMRVSTLKLPKPCSSAGILSTRCRINTIREWDRRARDELGVYVDQRFGNHIRSRIGSHPVREEWGGVAP